MREGAGRPLARLVLFGAVALGGAAFDLTTKSVIFSRVGPPGSPPRTVIPDILELRTSYNPGALFGWGGDLKHGSLIFAFLSMLAALGICSWLYVRRADLDRRLVIALGLVMAGAIGNCHDRLFYGKVRDFVHFHVDSINFSFAIFNFADNMLVLGAVMLMLMALQPEEDPVANASAPGDPSRPIPTDPGSPA